MIRSVTSDYRFATEWSLSVKGESKDLFVGDIYPYQLVDLGTEFTRWDELFTPLQFNDSTSFPQRLIGSKIISLDVIHQGRYDKILEIHLQKDSGEAYKMHFWNSWAFYSNDLLMTDYVTDSEVREFNSVAQGETLRGFTGNDFGFYSCSLVFDTLRLRRIGSSEPEWSWQIYDDQGRLLWRAPTGVEASGGLIAGVENPSV